MSNFVEVFVSIRLFVQTPEGPTYTGGMAQPSGNDAPAVMATTQSDSANQQTMSVPPDSNKPKSQGGCGGGDPIFSFVLLGVMFVVFYFFLIRPQQKRTREHSAMLNSLAKGDKIITSGGILGTIVALTDQFATIEIQDKVRMKVLRSHMQGKQPIGINGSESNPQTGTDGKDKSNE
jgi:preprotein translocase subunit YajC